MVLKSTDLTNKYKQMNSVGHISYSNEIYNKKIFIGRYYGTFILINNHIPRSEQQLCDIILGPNKQVYYHKTFQRNTNIEKGDFVLFSPYNKDSYEIFLFIPINKAAVIYNHENDYGNKKLVHKLKYHSEWEKYISQNQTRIIHNDYEESFTDDEFKIINSSEVTIIFPKHWGHSTFLSYKQKNTIYLFYINDIFHNSIKNYMHLIELRKKQKEIERGIVLDPYDSNTFKADLEQLIVEIENYVNQFDVNKIIDSYKVTVESTYITKSGGDDRLYANYVETCDIRFDSYINTFFPLPECFESRGYCNVYSCEDWKDYRDSASLIQERNINNFKNNYNKASHISSLLYEKVSEPFNAKSRSIWSLYYLEKQISELTMDLEKQFPMMFIENYSFILSSRDDLIEIIYAFNNRDKTKYRFEVF